MMKKEKGFTLIELLVVVAIIAILSGIAFISIQGARLRAFDTQIRSELSQIRSNAEMHYYEAGGSYDNYSDSYGWETIKGKIPGCSVAIISNGGLNIAENEPDEYQLEIESGGTPQNYIAWAPLCSEDDEGEERIYCIDATGNALETSALNLTAIRAEYDCTEEDVI